MIRPRLEIAVHRRWLPHSLCGSALLCLLVACGERAPNAEHAESNEALSVFVAASLAGPMREIALAFERETGHRVQLESGASLDHARTITDLGRIPDLVILADHEVIQQLLMPAHTTWYAQIAANRIVIAYRDGSRFAAEMDSTRWHQILRREGVEIGRPDPARAPAGYRALLVLRLAEKHYGIPGLAEAILANASRRHVRANAAELSALLELGEVDYIIEYESLARARAFRFVQLPREIDLGDRSLSESYAAVHLRTAGSTPRDSITMKGAPILYGLTVPRGAPHARAAERLAAFVVGEVGTRILRDAHVDVLTAPVVVGSGAPPAFRAAEP